MSFIFVFLDGTGIGRENRLNPFYKLNLRYLPLYENSPPPPDGKIKAIDAVLGVEGIPQSATGQTSIFTGLKAMQILGRHKGNFPGKVLRSLIFTNNIFRTLKESELSVNFINAYPYYSDFFTDKHIFIKENGEMTFSDKFPDLFKKRISVTTCQLICSGHRPHDEIDIKSKKAIYQDYTNKSLSRKGSDIIPFSPETAGEILYKNSLNYNFTLYEYFQTDFYGHRKTNPEKEVLLKNLERFICRTVSMMDLSEDTLVITSDHGNIEDSTHSNHTKNKVPLLIWGKGSDTIPGSVNSIADIKKSITDFLIKENS